MTDAVSYFTREFYKGGDDLTDSISKKLSLEVREAEMLKRGAAPVAAGSPSTNVPIVMVDSADAEKLRGGSGITRGPLTSVGGLPSGSSGGGGGEADRVYECISGIIEDICHDINISIDYFENQYDKKVDEIYLTGGGALTVGLQETLERTVQKPVTRWNPLQFFEQKLSAESAQELQDYASQGIIALGLASRIVG
jgi:Tfp pilus assembly PilM family ATPase